MPRKKHYQVTIGYKAILTVDVRANSEAEAKKEAIEIFNAQRHKWRFGVELQADDYEANGIIDMSATWDKI